MKDRFIREAECKNITGLSRSTRWRMEKTQAFPKKYKLSQGAVAYKLSEIENWMETRSN
ncbi:MAG: hypothetical protein COA47_03010 [Robiginitomaculum sp.]|nr:MAG: hypothetical protein COA47_03010 [Robiginitomaculum sp.]